MKYDIADALPLYVLCLTYESQRIDIQCLSRLCTYSDTVAFRNVTVTYDNIIMGITRDHRICHNVSVSVTVSGSSK